MYSHSKTDLIQRESWNKRSIVSEWPFLTNMIRLSSTSITWEASKCVFCGYIRHRFQGASQKAGFWSPIKDYLSSKIYLSLCCMQYCCVGEQEFGGKGMEKFCPILPSFKQGKKGIWMQPNTYLKETKVSITRLCYKLQHPAVFYLNGLRPH